MMNNELKKITKKKFIELLTDNTSIFVNSVSKWSDTQCIAAMEDISNISPDEPRRVVLKESSNYLWFNNGCYLCLNLTGKKDYFSYKNNAGIKFVVRRLTYYDKFNNISQLDYVIYIILEAEASVPRDLYHVQVSDEIEKIQFCKWLKANGYYYEAASCFNGYCITIKCGEREKEIIKHKIKKIRGR